MDTTFIIRKRKSLKITQAAVAKYLGVNRQTYIRWEHGDDMPVHQLISLGRLLGFKVMLVPDDCVL